METEVASVFAALIAYEQQYGELFGEANPDPVYACDVAGRLAYCNAAFERVTGYSARELAGRALTSLLVEADRGRARQHLEHAQRGEAQRCEVTGTARDGREFTLALVCLPLISAGRIDGVYGTARDVTARAVAERAADEADARYRLLAENVQDMISLHDATGTFLYASPSAYGLLGLHPVELVGRSVWELVVEEDLPVLERAYRDILQREGRGPATYRARRADGRIGWFETTARMVMSAETGTPWRITAITRDITERREFEQHLMRGQKMEALGRLAGGIAHDFNNMLTVIGGHAELLAARLDVGIERDNAEHIRAAAQRAAALTRQLLRFSRPDGQDVRLTDLNAVVLDLQSMLNRLLGDDVRMDVSLEPRLRSVRCEPAALEQVVLNLAVNARDAMPHGGVVQIGTQSIEVSEDELVGLDAGRYVLLTVSDNGSGMSAAVASRAFEPFFTTKPEGRGTGLGLSTVYSVVTQCGGEVALESTPGEGTTFRLYFPAYDAPAAQTLADRRADAAALEGTETILVAEDDTAVRALVSAVLQRYGYNVLTAVDGTEALELFRTRHADIDAIVSDVNMPGMQGPEFVRLATQVSEALPVLYISGFTADSLDLEQVDARSEFLAKPFTPVELARAVRRVLAATA